MYVAGGQARGPIAQARHRGQRPLAGVSDVQGGRRSSRPLGFWLSLDSSGASQCKDEGESKFGRHRRRMSSGTFEARAQVRAKRAAHERCAGAAAAPTASAVLLVDPVPGSVVVFPSFLPHFVFPTLKDASLRLSVAFNFGSFPAVQANLLSFGGPAKLLLETSPIFGCGELSDRGGKHTAVSEISCQPWVQQYLKRHNIAHAVEHAVNSVIAVSARNPLQSIAKLLAGTVDHSLSQAPDGGDICSDEYTAEHGLNSVVEQAIDSAIEQMQEIRKHTWQHFFLKPTPGGLVMHDAHTQQCHRHSQQA